MVTNGRARAAVVVIALLVAGLSAPVSPAGGTEQWPVRKGLWPADTVPGSLLVTTTDGQVEVVEVEPGEEAVEAARLRTRPGVFAVEPDHLRHALRTPNDPQYAQQWSHAMTGAEAAWDVSTGDPGVKVAVVDTGVDGTHPGLAANIVGQVDVSSGQIVPKPLRSDNDACGDGHGTMVAGVLGALGNDGNDVAGVAWDVGILDVAAGDPNLCKLFADSAVVAGITYATTQNVDAINLSLGGRAEACPTALQTAIDAALAKEIVVVAAAGNEELDFPGLTSVPASCNGVISVGAVGETSAPAPYSNANAYVDLVAPGGDLATDRGILSTRLGGGTATLDGTSFSAPYVTGAVALLRSADPTLGADVIEAILEETAVHPSGVRTDGLGWGRLDLAAAVSLAATGPVPKPKPATDFPVGLVVRVSAEEAVTDAVRQAVAMSQFVFTKGQAQHVIVARRDDFADALAGSSLGFGFGPVLFTERTGSLNATTATELARVLPKTGRVYLLGGTAALPEGLEAELRGRGFSPVRLAGVTREITAAAIADEVRVRVRELGFTPSRTAILATGRAWPDAVTAGSLGAWFGYPILLTEPTALPPATRDKLAMLRPQRLYVVGGTAAVSDAVAAAARDAGGSQLVRLAGIDRSGTAMAVARRFREDFRAENGVDPTLAIGVNLRRDGGFAHVLSASAAIGAFSGVYLPVEGVTGDDVPAAVVPFACSFEPFRGIIAGDVDVVNEAAKERLNALLEHRASDCP